MDRVDVMDEMDNIRRRRGTEDRGQRTEDGKMSNIQHSITNVQVMRENRKGDNEVLGDERQFRIWVLRQAQDDARRQFKI
jgi:hypothetical protein